MNRKDKSGDWIKIPHFINLVPQYYSSEKLKEQFQGLHNIHFISTTCWHIIAPRFLSCQKYPSQINSSICNVYISSQ